MFNQIILFISIAINSFFFFVLYKRKSKISNTLRMVIFGIILWAFIVLIWPFFSNGLVRYYLGIVGYWGPLISLSSLLYFSFIFPKTGVNFDLKKTFPLTLFCLGIFLTLIPNFVLKGVNGDGYYLETGPGLYALFLIFFLEIIWSFINLIKKYFLLSGIYKSQLKIFFIGAFFTTIIGFISNALLAILKIYEYVWLGPAISIILIAFIIYAITRYRFMDIRLIIARTLTFGFLVLFSTFIYTLLSVVVGVTFENLIGTKSNIVVGTVVSILVITGYKPLRNFLEKGTDKFLFKKTYNADTIISKISDVASSILNFHQLLASISNTIDDAFHCGKIAVGLFDKENRLYVAHQQGFEENLIKNFTFGKEEVLPRYFQSAREIQVIDELKSRYEAGEYQPKSVELLNGLYNLDIGLVIPLFVKEKMIGVFVMGNKKSGEPYNHQDLNVLKIIAGQSSIAIENATLYDELKDYNLKLDSEVKIKTAELQKANDELKQLDEAKSEFISIASHQLRTPLTIIKGYISMMIEGNFGKVSVKIEDNLKKVFGANERLINLVENLLDISRIESGRQEFNYSTARLEDMASAVVDDFKKNAKDKKLILIFHKPTHPTPEVKLDSDKIHEVMMNFVDNAIKYTKHGKVEVSIIVEEGSVIYCVKDSGSGISPELMAVLFQKFSRGAGSFRTHTEGLGLGLYVAKMMIDAHHGKIWAESNGIGKGSKFCFSLPYVKQP